MQLSDIKIGHNDDFDDRRWDSSNSIDDNVKSILGCYIYESEHPYLIPSYLTPEAFTSIISNFSCKKDLKIVYLFYFMFHFYDWGVGNILIR